MKKYRVEIYNAIMSVYQDVYHTIDFGEKKDAEECFYKEMDRLKNGEGIRLIKDGKVVQEFE